MYMYVCMYINYDSFHNMNGLTIWKSIYQTHHVIIVSTLHNHASIRNYVVSNTHFIQI